MKAHAVANRSKPNRSARARPAAGKSARAADSAHERQAAGSAARFLRGESGLGAGLTPAVAARWVLPGSVPRALPSGLRASLEQAYDADLSGLRLHDDAPAHASARAFGARAFTAGSAIYFAQGAWAPGSAAGRELLAHEVAHAIQQTGRASHRGRRRLEPSAAGEAGVQRQTDPNEDVRKAKAKLGSGLEIGARFKEIGLLQPSTDAKQCVAAADRHLLLPEDAGVKKYAARIKAAVDGKSLADAVTALDLVFSVVAEAEKTDRVNALFFDAYKSLNADASALGVVGTELPEQTAFGSWSFYTANRPSTFSWVTALLKRHPVAGKYWPNMVVAVARVDFYGVTRGGLNLDPNMKFNDTMGDAIVDALLYQPTMSDERTVVALRALVGFDAIRLMPFAELAQAVKGAKSLIARMEIKLQLIERYTDPKYLARVAFQNKAEPEVFQIALEAGSLIAPIAERALQFWGSIKSLGKAVLVSEEADPKAKAQAERFKAVLRKRLPSLKPLAGLEKKLVPILAQATKLQAGAVPPPEAMSANFSAAARQVEALVHQLDGAIAARDKKLKTGALPPANQDPNSDTEMEPSAEETESVTDDMVYGVVMYLLFALQTSLVQYTAPKKGKEESQRLRDQDAAAARFRLSARGFGNLADMLGYQTLSQAAWNTYRGLQDTLKTSYVGLLAPFDLVPATLKEFSRDFPTGELVGGAISGAMLVETVYSLYYQNLLGKLKAELDKPAPGGTREFDYTWDPDKKAIVNDALAAADASLDLPRKYRVPKDFTVLYVRADDRSHVSKFLPRSHPQLKDLVAQHMGEDENGYIPENYSAHTEGFVVWMLPGMGKFAAQLASVPGVVDLPLADGTKLGAPSAYPTPSAWLSALNRAAGGDEAVKEKLAAAIKVWMDKSLHDLDMPLRRATNNERRKVGPLISQQWEKLTKSFLESPNTYFEAPREALRITLIFAGNIQPVTGSEQKLQMTGLMLELAPVLSRKLGPSTAFGNLVQIASTDRLDIVLALHAHMAGAARLAADSANLAELKTLNLAFPIAELAGRAGQLKSLAEEFRATAESAQAKRFMEGVVADRMLHVPDRGHPLVAKRDDKDQESNDIFQIGGVVYQLLKVHHDFSYQPELLSMASGVRWGGGDISNRRLWVDGKELAADAPEVPLVTIMRTPTGGSPKEIVVTSGDTEMLSELTYALDLNITLKHLETLATVLEGFASVLTTAIQLAFPEFATEIAAAEVAGSVIQFLGSPEFAMLRTALESDAGGLFDQGLKKVTDQFTVDALWDYMLFDVKPPVFETLSEALGMFGRMGMFKNRENETTKSAVRKVFGRLIRVAGELVQGFESVHDHVSFPFRKTSLYVQGSPWLSLLLRFVANNLYRLEGMSLRELGVEETTEMIAEVQQLYLRFETVVAGLGEYELPEELVPLPAILDMLVNFLIDHLPFKYRRIVREGKTQLQELFTWLEEKAAKALKDNGIDPNRIWRDYAAKQINPYIQQAGKEVSQGIEGVLKRVPFLHDLATINVPAVAAQFVDRDVEPQPKLEAGVTAPLAVPLLPDSAGAPLNAGTRAQAQRGFGHDFSHVRMHRSDAIDTSLRTSGARAAAAGSHVYVDSGISVSTPGGRDVLHHELAHVLQQTGPRPLGASHSDAPVRGGGGDSGNAGWSIDRSAEAQADRLAQSSRTAADAPRPVTPARGLQPSLYDVVTKLFVELGDPSKLQENAAEMLKRGVKDKELAQAAPGLKESFAAKLFAALIRPDKPGSVVSYVSPFEPAGDDLLEYVLKNRKEDIEKGLPHVLSAGLHKVEPKGKDPFWILVPGRVETALEEFFFGKTGVSVDFEFHTKKQSGPDQKERTVIDPDKPFSKIRFNYVHLPMVGGGAKLWSDIIDNTFPKAGPKASLYQANARLALRGLKPGPGIFTHGKGKSGKTLVFARKTRELIETYVNPPPKRDLPGDAVPKWSDYIKPDPQPATPGKDYGQIGLRLGLYKDRENLREQRGTDRASHHTVQYLLLEYFLNSKDKVRPFPNDLSLYPNVKHTASRVDVITKTPGANAGINISANEQDRGGSMPTILLSVHTHTMGNVHISPKADDIEGTPPSQGSTVHGEFRKFLGGYAPIVMGKPKPLEAMAKKAAGKVEGKDFQASDIPEVGTQKATQEGMSLAIFTATCKTYTWMRDHMNTKLAKAIDEQDISYYNKLVETAANKSIYDPAHGGAQPGYIPSPVGSAITAAVLKRQIAVFEAAAYGFEAINP